MEDSADKEEEAIRQHLQGVLKNCASSLGLDLEAQKAIEIPDEDFGKDEEIVNVGRDKEVLSNSSGSPMTLLLHAVVGIQVHVFFCLEPSQFCLNCDMSVRSRLV